MNDMGHDVVLPRSDIGIKACAYHESSGTTLELERMGVRVVIATCHIQPEYIEEQHIRSVLFTFCSGTDPGHDCKGYGCGPPELTGACNAVSPSSLATFCQCRWKFWTSRCDRPNSKMSIVGRTSCPKRRERIAMSSWVRCSAKAGCEGKKAASAPSLDESDGHLAARHEQYRGLSILRCWKKGVQRIDGLRHHESMHPGLHLDHAFMGRKTEDRASPILVGKFSKDRWLTTDPMPCKITQHRWIIGKLVNDVIMSGVRTLNRLW